MSRSWPAIALLLWMGSPTAARAQVAGSLTTGTNFPTVVPTAAPAGRSEAAQLGVTVGVGETDNVNLTPDDRQAQTISTTELDFGYRRTGSALTADMAGDFDYLDYLQNAYGGQLLGRFDGQAALSLWEGRFKWVLQDAYGQTQLDPLTPTVPTNLENTNVLLTGPDFTLRPAPQTTLILSARYSLDTYQTSPYDGWQSLENAALEHALSAASTVSLHADLVQMHFDQTDINPDYDLDRFYLRYAVEGARTSI
ncbi:MAG TPA: hypothetical protein VMB48_02140, partial [Steroidobacteraceae bacterium]|nr:hypothetical protein [Steroidobacteraceae bacterium]